MGDTALLEQQSASARAAHFEATLHYLVSLARRYKKVVTCSQLIEEIGRALVTAPADYQTMPKWQPIAFALQDGRPIVAQIHGQTDPVVCAYRAGSQRMMAGWWAGAHRVEPIAFFYPPAYGERTGQ